MASGKITGTTKGTSASKYNFWVEWSSFPYPSEGCSVVKATSYLQRNDGYAASAYNLDINAKDKRISVGRDVKTSDKKGIDTRNSAKVVIATAQNIKVLHDQNGYATVNISSSFPKISENLTGGTLSKNISLDKLDVSLPNFAGKPIVFSNITQTSVDVSFSSNDILDKIEYSLDSQKTWVEVNSKSFTISELNPYTDYTLYVRIRKRSNQKTKTSSAWNFKTLPIYITDILVEDNISVDVGSYTELEYSLVPQNASVKTLDIKSNNTDIVSIDGNKLVGLSKGQTTVTLTAKDGSGVSKNITVSAVKRVEGITTNQSEITLPKNTSTNLQYTILPSDANNKNVILISSDESVVRVDGNSIFGVENGEAVVTITTVDGGFFVDVAVSVFGEYVWYDYPEPIEILNAADVQCIKSNITTIRSMLMAKGYDVEPLNNIEASANLPLGKIFDLLQKIEYNLDIINSFEIKSIYYDEPVFVNVTGYASNKEDIWRWIQILNDMYNILNGTFGMWQTALTTDGYPTIDGKKLIIRGDFVG